MRLFLAIMLLLPFSHAGCTSFRTTSLGRLDSDSLFVECFGRKKKGIPVKLKVPTHVVVSVYEQQVLIRGNDGVKLQSFSPPQYEVESKLAYTDKVFLVDFVRPAGGTLTLGSSSKEGITFDDDQYFKTIQATVEENTMQQIGQALNTIKGTFTSAGKTVSSGVVTPENNTLNLKFEKSIIACQRFDMARPDWEHEVNDFVQQYIAECETCPVPSQKQYPVPPAVDAAAEQSADQPRKQLTGIFRTEAPPALELLE